MVPSNLNIHTVLLQYTGLNCVLLLVADRGIYLDLKGPASVLLHWGFRSVSSLTAPLSLAAAAAAVLGTGAAERLPRRSASVARVRGGIGSERRVCVLTNLWGACEVFFRMFDVPRPASTRAIDTSTTPLPPSLAMAHSPAADGKRTLTHDWEAGDYERGLRPKLQDLKISILACSLW